MENDEIKEAVPQETVKEEVKTEPVSPETEATKDEGKKPESTPQEPAKVQPSEPERVEGESDIAYNKRVEIFQTKMAKSATTDKEERSRISKILTGLYDELHDIKDKEAPKPQAEKKPEAPSQENQTEEEELRQAMIRLGFVPKNELDTFKQNLEAQIKAEMSKKEVESARTVHQKVIGTFYDANDNVFRNAENIELFEDHVKKYYKIEPNTSPKDLEFILDSAYRSLFPTSNARKENSIKAQEKVDIVNISGGSQKSQKSTDKGASNEASEVLKKFGWSQDTIDKLL